MIGHLVVGPAQHGVVRFARNLATRAGGPVVRLGTGRVRERAALRAALELGARADVVHLQFTDALYGSGCSSAAQAFVELRDAVPAPVTVTLHDLPDPADEPGRYRRRAAAYAQVVSAVDGVVVSSRHEAGLLGLVGGHRATAVVPLPIDRYPVSGGPSQLTRDVAVLGFVYPGKGHAEALADLRGPLGFTVLGRAADGHADLVAELERRARAAGLAWSMTGFVADGELAARLRRVGVPLVPAQRISASGSLGTWLAAGRRPLVADGPYTREVAIRLPGAVRLYRPGQLAGLVSEALADPASTLLPAGSPVGPDSRHTASGYRTFLTTVARDASRRLSA